MTAYWRQFKINFGYNTGFEKSLLILWQKFNLEFSPSTGLNKGHSDQRKTQCGPR